MRRRGLTLIEVVAALALMATAVTALVVAHSAALRELATARDLDTAATLAEDLLLRWTLAPAPGDAGVEGGFPERPDWRWRRTRRPLPAEDLVELHLVVTDARSGARLREWVWIERRDER